MYKEHSIEYESYIHSQAWKQKALERKRVDNFRCVMCGRPETETDRLEVHHISYDRLGHERVMHDLVTLCPDCHRKIHNYYNRKRD